MLAAFFLSLSLSSLSAFLEAKLFLPEKLQTNL